VFPQNDQKGKITKTRKSKNRGYKGGKGKSTITKGDKISSREKRTGSKRDNSEERRKK
jgi:hypothetical protein